MARKTIAISSKLQARGGSYTLRYREFEETQGAEIPKQRQAVPNVYSNRHSLKGWNYRLGAGQ